MPKKYVLLQRKIYMIILDGFLITEKYISKWTKNTQKRKETQNIICLVTMGVILKGSAQNIMRKF